jgi:hypothetical protein
MKTGFLFLISFLILSCSVKNEAKRDVNVLSLSTRQVIEYISLSEIISSAIMVPLETNDDLLIKEIRGVERHGSHYFISDGQTLYKYDANGRFVDKLSSVGSGPEEYLQISDFQIDPMGNIWILSRGGKSVYKYNPSKEFQEKISFPYLVDHIKLLNADTMILYVGNETDGNNTDQIKLLSISQRKITDGFLKIDSNKAMYLHVRSKNHFSSTEDGNALYFFQLFNDTVYKLSETGLEPHVFVNIDNKNIPESFFDSKYANIMSFFQDLFKHSYAYGTAFYIETENNYLYSCFYNKKCHIASVSKSDHSQMLVFTGIKEDVHLYDYPIKLEEIDLFIQSDNQLVIPILPFKIMEYAEKSLSVEDKQKLYDRLKIVSEDQNPILLQITF